MAGRFTIEDVLGRGGMGVVCRAFDKVLGQQVALKFLSPSIAHDEEALDGLLRETRKSLALTHPGIVRIFDFHAPENEVPFIAMEYVDGIPLNKLKLRQPQRVFRWEELAPLVAQLCAALEYAHGEKIVHRDIKPANLLVDRGQRLKLTDFGIAATVSDTLGRTTRYLGASGTLAYMSPQQLRGKLPHLADDVYALGATVYELLTGKPPFYTGDIPTQVRDEMPTPIPERLREFDIDGTVPSVVCETVAACLAKESADRPASVLELGRCLGLGVPGTSIETRATSISGFDNQLRIGPKTSPAEESAATVCSNDTVKFDSDTASSTAPDEGDGKRPLGIVFVVLCLLCIAGWYFGAANPERDERSEDSPRPGVVLTNLVRLVSGNSMRAMVVEVERDLSESIDTNRLKSLVAREWSHDDSNWRLTDGLLETWQARAENDREFELNLVFPQTHATNFEFGVAFYSYRELTTTLLRQMFFFRARTNEMDQIAHWWSALDGLAVRIRKKTELLPHGRGSPEGSSRRLLGAEFRETDMLPIESMLPNTPKFSVCHEMMEHLKQTKTVRDGGHWLIVQANGPHIRMVLDGKAAGFTHLGHTAYDEPLNDVALYRARRMANRAGVLGLTLAINDPNDGVHTRYEGFYFRNLDAQASPPPAVPSGSRIELREPNEAPPTPPLSTAARKLGIRQLMARSVAPSGHTYHVRRNGHVDLAGKPERVIDVRSWPWGHGPSPWSFSDGVLRISLPTPAVDRGHEHGFYTDPLGATNFEFGVAYRFNRRHGLGRKCDIGPCVTPNLQPEWVARNVGLDGLMLALDTNAAPIVRSGLDGNDWLRRFNYRPIKNSQPFSESMVGDPADDGLRAIIDQLRQTRLVREGGNWMVVQLRDGRFRSIVNGDNYCELNLLNPPLFQNPETYRIYVRYLRRLANQPAAVGLRVSMTGYYAPLVGEFEGFYFRSLDAE